MKYSEKRRRTVGRLGRFALIAGAIALAASTASFFANDRGESAGRSAAFPFGTTNSPGVVGEFRYQMWKHNHLPAGSILEEINFRIRRDWTEAPRPMLLTTHLDVRSETPRLFDLPDAKEVERVLSGGP